MIDILKLQNLHRSLHTSRICQIQRSIHAWGGQPGLRAQMSKLQGFQNESALKIFRKPDCGEEAIKKLGWITLENRRVNYRAILAHRIVKGENINHLQDLLITDDFKGNYYFRECIFNRLPCPKAN